MCYIEQDSLVKETEDATESQLPQAQNILSELEKDPAALEDAIAFAIYTHPTKRRRGDSFVDEAPRESISTASRSGKTSPRKCKINSER